MVRRKRLLGVCAVSLLALSLGGLKGTAGTIHTSVCELVSRPDLYNRKLVVVRAEIRGSGIHMPQLKDRHCMSSPGVGLGEDAKAQRRHLEKLRNAIHSAFLSSTLNAHKHVEAVLLGTFASPLGSVRAELRLRDVYSVNIVEGGDLVPEIPPPTVH